MIEAALPGAEVEVRDEDEYFKGINDKPDPKMLGMVTDVIAARVKPWSPAMTADPVQKHLLDIIKAKQKGAVKKKPKAAAPDKASNVIDIMDALKRSLGEKPAARR